MKNINRMSASPSIEQSRRGSTRLIRVGADEPASLHDRTTSDEYCIEARREELLAAPGLSQRRAKAQSMLGLAMNRAVGRAGPKKSAIKDPLASKKRSAFKRSRRVHFFDEKTESVLAAGAAILLPRDRFLSAIWAKVIVVALTAELVLWPMRLPWPVPWAYDIITDVVFILEIIITFRSAFVTQAGVLEVRPRAIRANYLRLRGAFDETCGNSFWLDSAAVFPQHIAILLGSKRWVVLLCTIPRLGKVNRLVRHFRRAEEDVKILNVQQIALFKYGLMLLGAPHWWACLWWYVATTHKEDDPLGNSTWLHQSVFFVLLPAPVAFNDHAHSPVKPT